MNKDTLREYTSYSGLFIRLLGVRKAITPASVPFGPHKDQHFLYYEPSVVTSPKIVVWIHGGGWNSGNPETFDYVGQCIAGAGYRFVSIGYRLSPRFKYPCQIEDVCRGFRAAVGYLQSMGIDTSKLIVSGPSAGAHLSALLCYSDAVQAEYGVDVSGIAGFIGSGGPYCFSECTGFTLRTLLSQLFEKDYDRQRAEPLAQMGMHNIPMLLMQSRHDGLIPFACAESLAEKAGTLGIPCELYDIEDARNTHSWYTAGMFLETREKNKGLDRFFSWIEQC